jgi:hypothetical protein
MTLKSCIDCGKEISKSVSKCPGCGKDQRNWFLRHKIISFLGVIAILVIIIGSIGDKEVGVSPTSSVGSQSQTEKIYKINEVITLNNKMEVVLTKVEELSVLGDPNFLGIRVSDGGTFVCIQTTTKNISNEPIGSFSTPRFKLIDEKGTAYENDSDATISYSVATGIDNSKVLSDLNPGIKVNNVDVFEVSKDAYLNGKWYLQINSDQKIQIK